MQFINFLMLWGLLAIAIPVIIQIFTRKQASMMKWGAWMFIDLTMKKRKRRVLLEDILLLACRCLGVGLLALAFARPFVRPDSPVPWAVVLPLLLLAITLFGISFALWRYPKQRKMMMAAGIALFALAITCIVFERQLNLKRFGLGASKDIALVIDGSASMSMVVDGKSNFERGIEEARKYIEQSPRGTAFTVIIGGPVPQVMNPVPIADRRMLLNTLDRVALANGTMQIGGTLTAAAVALAAGHNAVKQIIIVGDGQTVGWQLDSQDRWKTVKRVFSQLGTSPIVTWRTLPLPTSIRNLAISSVSPSRDVVGTDRDVKINVTVVNAGTEAVTPKEITLTVEGEVKRHADVKQLEPGDSQTVTFKHRFKKTGSTIISANVAAEDDLPADDTYRYAMPVMKSLKVLIIDGESSPDPFRRGSTYVSLALRPELEAIMAQQTNLTPPAEGAGEKGGFLLETDVEDITVAGARKGFAGYAAVVLIGVRKFPAPMLESLARYCDNGGGIFMMPGTATAAETINSWQYKGSQVIPSDLAKWKVNSESAAVDISSFNADSIRRFRTNCDLSTVVPPGYWQFGESWASNSVVTAKFTNGDPLLMSRQFGRGMMIMSALPFDPQSGFTAKKGFLPFMHELAYSLARPAAVTLDIHPSDGVTLLLASGAAASGDSKTGEHGLVGYYYPKPNCEGKPIVRTDSVINFWWGTGSPFPKTDFPNDNFSIKWRGAIVAPETGVWSIQAEADDHFNFSIDGKSFNKIGSVKLTAGEPKLFIGTFGEDYGQAGVRLKWAKQDKSKKQMKYAIIPSEALLSHAAGIEGQGTVVEVVDPHGELFYGEIYSSEVGLFLRFARSVIPGVYTVQGLPEHLKELTAGLAGEEGKIYFSVSAGTEESKMEAITPEQISNLCKYVMISTATKEEDVIKSIGGQSFGKEVWRLLAIAALLFLVAEVAIARWIAISRRLGEQIDVDFKNDKLQASEAFKRTLAKLNEK